MPNQTADPPHHIAFVVLPEFSNMGLALAIEPLFVANWLAQRQIFRWSILSLDGLSVRASNGMHLPVDGALGEIGTYRTVIVVASFNVKAHAEDQRLLNWLRRMARFGADMGAIETGSEILAAAHLLDGHPATVHWDNLEGFQERYPDVEAVTQLYTMGRGRMTCAGATTTLDMMLRWIAEQTDTGLADEVAQHFLMARQRPPHQEQNAPDTALGSVANQKVQQALGIMQKTTDEPLLCHEVAARVGLSERQLQRHFQRHVGMSMAQQYLQFRLAKAHKLLQQTDLPVTEVAISSGFGSLENFSRTYRRHFGCSPSADRQQSTTAPVFRHRTMGRG
ncbi:AraC family transcriptional regulator with amidase-like domain [Dongia mobilis]|uniref:AraC family transcriptional regulator with amidase-like domain n=1 Tax=Dongia mobilis TaxID=578943 RepID=A0A4R6WQ67_9PROT|nr:GlxA family transcriptional regulator [Dongia mobilis]TDQ83354.1 AraC family transcriptional regulator with amidase-like domain [Dongia mobilis]